MSLFLLLLQHLLIILVIVILKVASTYGEIIAIAGTGTAGTSGDGGSATNALLSYPSGICVDGTGNVYIADAHNHRIRKVSTCSYSYTCFVYTFMNNNHDIHKIRTRIHAYYYYGIILHIHTRMRAGDII